MLLLAALAQPVLSAEEPIISDIRAFHWRGQTFLQWEEKEQTAWTTFNVYRADAPIKSVDAPGVECLARRIIPRSGRSFYDLKRLGFKRDLPCNEKRSTIGGSPRADVEVKGLPLPEQFGKSSITGGIFVHTARKKGAGWYAVTCTENGKSENKTLTSGANSLREPVKEETGNPEPYLIDARGDVPSFEFEGKTPLKVYLTAIGGTVDASSPVAFGLESYRTYLLWMPPEFGWREGLPTIFFVKNNGNRYYNWIEVQPDDSNFAFMGFANSWWFGYNERILDPDQMKDSVVRLYSQKKLRYIINWLFEEYPMIDRTSVELMGSSMGGTGCLFFGLRNPDLVAVINATVPAGNLPQLPRARETLEHLFGPLDADIMTENGESVWNELNNTWFVRNRHNDLPFIMVLSSRYDTWMLWEHSASFIKALDESGHACAAWWNIAGHNGSSGYAIPVFSDLPYKNKIVTDISMPGISEFSWNEDYGNGEIENGDRYGGMNCYVQWSVLKDEPDEYAIVLKPETAVGMQFQQGFSLLFTPRRLQNFKIKPGDEINYETSLDGRRSLDKGVAAADANGLLKIRISSGKNRGDVHVILKR